MSKSRESGRAARRRAVRRAVWFRMLGGVLVAVGVVLAVGVVWVLGPGAAWWLEHVDGVPVGGKDGLKGKELSEALGTVRGHAMALGTGLLASVAVYYTAANAASARRSAEAAQHTAHAAQETARLGEQGLVTGRYTAAIEGLGVTALGGIYALERIARDSPRDHPTVMAVLAAYVREHSHDLDAHTVTPPDDGAGEQATAPRTRFRPDLQAALTVLGRRDRRNDTHRLDLAGAHLGGADLTHADLSGTHLTDANLSDTHLSNADLTGANLSNANLAHANLTYADLAHANLSNANLIHANLIHANLIHANLIHANLIHANLYYTDLTSTNLTDAHLGGAHLASAHLGGANLTGANLGGADLTDANLYRTDLTGANLGGADLTGAELSGANLEAVSWSAETRWPARSAERIRARSREITPGWWTVTPLPEGERRAVVVPADPEPG
ncbi:pentapeptide repeat-containing protein [Thermomonospora umbrina]|uniref:Uncharacterized protein YjbI with pentapeptide repeats n=1 Tax=Thermomonospora umbrina TaxID=111806 RepID=A0A3D9SXC4_9ACTN|nr:pentapeptide repeat-containing protein [Thermomonospora umbrina]REF00607.1 uncharacterized protein YjbI with pentapeptide repeats [Thermomonospora umbrina]